MGERAGEGVGAEAGEPLLPEPVRALPRVAYGDRLPGARIDVFGEGLDCRHGAGQAALGLGPLAAAREHLGPVHLRQMPEGIEQPALDG